MRVHFHAARLARLAPVVGMLLIAAVAVTGCNSSSDWTKARAQEPGVIGTAGTATAGSNAAPVLVNCEPHQRALVRQRVVNGETVAQVDCISTAAAAAPVYTDAYGRPLAMTPYGAAAVPAGYVVPEATVGYPAPRVVRTAPRARRVVYEQPERVVRRSGRSWKKSALVIGGSTAAGAGIGGLIGGKKGALAGAAIGGGASTIFEAIKHR